jgi:mono/diheme cytochrome c family protein
MDELLQRAAENMGMPPALAERSARARADKEGTTVETVLAEWAGEPVPDQAPAGTPAEPATQADALDSPNEGADSPPAAAGAPEPQSASTAPPAAPTEVTTDYLVALAADAKRMPEKLVRSSGEARARNEGSDLDVVLAKWAGVDLEDLRARAEAGEPLPVAEPESASAPQASPPPANDQPAPTPAAEQAPAQAAPAAAAAAAMSVDELLDKAAEAKGMPAPIAKRSAEARAKKDGTTLEAVLAEWAGIDPSAVGTAAPEPSATQPAPTAAAAAAEPDRPAGADIEVIEPAAAGDEQDLDTDVDDIEPVAARSGGYPAWLAAAFVIIPLLAVTYILVSPNGPDCGTGGQLNVDPVTGLAVNCDGSEYGGASVDFFAQGAGIYAQCAACHGANGEGGGNFPAFTGGAVLATFPEGQCSDHVEWVALGTANYPEDTYGATAKPVGGSGAVMPGYEGVLTPEQIASVVLYERVQFGGEPLEVAELDCGLVVPEGEVATTDGQMTEASSP